MENLRLKITRITAEGPDAKTFRLGLDREIPYKPGQYMVVTLNVDGADISKPLSISSAPTEKGYIEFTKKITSSGFSKTLDTIKIGDPVGIRMPMGNFIFEGQFERAAFLSGGIGITPIRSMIKYATDMKAPSSLALIYSGRTPENIIFREDFNSMRKINSNLKLVYTLTDCREKKDFCRLGRIDADMIREEVPDYKERKFFTCGPPAMVDAMCSILTVSLGLPKGNIIKENFVGY